MTNICKPAHRFGRGYSIAEIDGGNHPALRGLKL